MFISKAAIWALNNPSYVQLLMDAQDLTLLMIGSAYPAPDSIRVCGIGKEPINQYRQEQLARFLEKEGAVVKTNFDRVYGHEWQFWDESIKEFLDWLPRTDAYAGKLRKI